MMIIMTLSKMIRFYFVFTNTFVSFQFLFRSLYINTGNPLFFEVRIFTKTD